MKGQCVGLMAIIRTLNVEDIMCYSESDICAGLIPIIKGLDILALVCCIGSDVLG